MVALLRLSFSIRATSEHDSRDSDVEKHAADLAREDGGVGCHCVWMADGVARGGSTLGELPRQRRGHFEPLSSGGEGGGDAGARADPAGDAC